MEVDLGNPQHVAPVEASAIGEPMECCSNDSWRVQHDIRRVNILNLAKKFAALDLSFGAAGDRKASREILRKHIDQERIFYSSERDQESCDLSGEKERERKRNDTLTFTT